MPALLIVEDAGEDAPGVEPGEAQPVYRSVRADQSGGGQVAYDPLVLYREISHPPPHGRRQHCLVYILSARIANGKGQRQDSRAQRRDRRGQLRPRALDFSYRSRACQISAPSTTRTPTNAEYASTLSNSGPSTAEPSNPPTK